MSVELDPVELGFKRPFDHEVSQVLRLRNPNSDPVAFKVKTTAPKQYCVRPNSGRIEPNGDVEVQVLLQAMKEQPAPDARCRDKFLVQSVAISPSAGPADGSNISQIWSNIEQTAKSSIQERKIKVNFLPADGGAQTNGVPAGGHEDDQPPAYSSPSPSAAAVTPSRDKSEGDTTLGSTIMGGGAAAGAAAGLGAAAGAVSNAGSSAAKSIPTNQEELQAQLDSANATIQKLRADAAEGLRQRKPQEAAQKAVESVQQSLQNAPAPGGVPIQYVAALCLLCFIIAYLFF